MCDRKKELLARAYDLCEDVSAAYFQYQVHGRSEAKLNLLDEAIGALRKCVEELNEVSPESVSQLKELVPESLRERLTFL